MLCNYDEILLLMNTKFVQSPIPHQPPPNSPVYPFMKPRSDSFLTSTRILITNMSQRYLDNKFVLSTLPRLYGNHYDKTREATSSLCFRPARAHARAAHHLPLSRNGDESPCPRLSKPVTGIDGASEPCRHKHNN